MKHPTEAIIDWQVTSDHPLSNTLNQLEHLIWDIFNGCYSIEPDYMFHPEWERRADGFYLVSIEGHLYGQPWKVKIIPNFLYLIAPNICYRWHKGEGSICINETLDDFLYRYEFESPLPMDNNHQQDAISLLKMIVTLTTEAYYANQESGTTYYNG